MKFHRIFSKFTESFSFFQSQWFQMIWDYPTEAPTARPSKGPSPKPSISPSHSCFYFTSIETCPHECVWDGEGCYDGCNQYSGLAPENFDGFYRNTTETRERCHEDCILDKVCSQFIFVIETGNVGQCLLYDPYTLLSELVLTESTITGHCNRTPHPVTCPTTNPTSSPTTKPSTMPSTAPTSSPTSVPTPGPTTSPTPGPTTSPT